MAFAREKKVILIVDDMPQMREILKSILLQLGYQHILSASNGIEAVGLLANNPVELVISDLIMPKMDGLALLTHIRQNEQLRFLPFVLVTGENEESKLEQVSAKGINGLIKKPFNMSALDQVLNSLFDPASSQRIKNREKLAQALKFIRFEGHQQKEKPKLLLVDDNATHLTQIASILGDEYNIKIAKTAKAAVKILLSETSIDLALIDIHMPEISGLQWMEYVKKQSSFATLPVIFISGVKDENTILKCYELGAVDFVAKPVQAKVLKAKIKLHLSHKKALDNLNNHLELIFMQYQTDNLSE